ncbi:hypothetical protein DFH27DRAFT_303013 [Peziza echinospora]|nr:hypothetical protein DFH27DRAFT_303013 [Peziza echinospora]
MQFTLTATTVLAGLISVVSALPAVHVARDDPVALKSNTFILYATADPNAATPLTSFYGQVSYANSSAYIGDIKYNTYSEPLILSYPDASVGRLSFTSYHSAPTGWQNLLIFPTENKGISFTIPHSGAVPPTAAVSGFTVDVGGTELFGYNGDTAKWFACPVEGYADGIRQIVYNGAGEAVSTGCTKVTLKASPYGVPN